MITLTPAAIAHIQKTLAREGGHAFRLSVKKSGCAEFRYVPQIVDEPMQGDIPCSVQADFPVFIDKACVDIFKGTTLDVKKQTLGQTQLVFLNPNVKAACGCGESFSVKAPGEGAEAEAK